MSVAHRYSQRIKEVVQFGIVGTQVYESAAFLHYQFLYLIIVVAFVFAANDEYDLCFHAFKCIPACVHIGSL